jgi:hypothetical protein
LRATARMNTAPSSNAATHSHPILRSREARRPQPASQCADLKAQTMSISRGAATHSLRHPPPKVERSAPASASVDLCRSCKTPPPTASATAFQGREVRRARQAHALAQLERRAAGGPRRPGSTRARRGRAHSQGVHYSVHCGIHGVLKYLHKGQRIRCTLRCRPQYRP